jgi:RNA polymerase sigma factor (sigma-70 family)
MARHPLDSVLDRLRNTASQHQDALLTDRQLLEQYIAKRDETAFEALVRRHGPMVLAVCRRVVANHQDADDAFQATFLVLVRKATSVSPPDRVGNWLYGVAYRAALKSKTDSARRGAREKQVNSHPEPATVEMGLWSDLIPLLDQEISALPDKLRLPIVLCDLEGKTRKQAARHLGWPEGTVAGRHAQARAILARRLARHGLPVSCGVLAVLFSGQPVSAAVPATLKSTTIQLAAAQTSASGVVSANVATLADGVLRVMLMSKLKLVAFVVVALATMTLTGSLLYARKAVAEAGPGRAVLVANNDQSDAPRKAEDERAPAKRPPTEVARQDRRAKVFARVVFDDDEMQIGPIRFRKASESLVIRSAEELAASARAAGDQPPDSLPRNLALQRETQATLAKFLGVEAIDWQKQMVVAVCGGRYRHHYELDFLSFGITGRHLTVTWRKKDLGPGTVTTPRGIALIERVDGTVQFTEQDEKSKAPGNRKEKARDPENDVKLELQKLNGTWRKVALEIEGRQNARFHNVDTLFIVQGDRFAIDDDHGNGSRSGRVKVIPAEHAIDLIITDGANKTTTRKLRYELKGDTLRIAWDDSTDVRPREMKTIIGTSYGIYTYRREVPPRKGAQRPFRRQGRSVHEPAASARAAGAGASGSCDDLPCRGHYESVSLAKDQWGVNDGRHGGLLHG